MKPSLNETIEAKLTPRESYAHQTSTHNKQQATSKETQKRNQERTHTTKEVEIKGEGSVKTLGGWFEGSNSCWRRLGGEE